LIEITLLVGRESDLPAGDSWLNDSEQAVLSGLRVERRRRDWRLGRWLAKQGVLRYMSEAGSPHQPADIEIRATEHGAPAGFVAGEPLPITLSLSHRGGHGLCALAAGEVELGCDLELVESHSDAFVRDYFTGAEIEQIGCIAGAYRNLAVTLVWSAKESALKALGEGLRLDTRSVEVDVGPLEIVPEWQALKVQHRDSERTFAGWWRRDEDRLLTVVSRPPCYAPLV